MLRRRAPKGGTEMLTVDQVAVLQNKVEREGKSVRRVPRELGISRVTAREYLEGRPEVGRRKSPARASPVLAAVEARLIELLEEGAPRTTRKQRVTATRLHRELLPMPTQARRPSRRLGRSLRRGQWAMRQIELAYLHHGR